MSDETKYPETIAILDKAHALFCKKTKGVFRSNLNYEMEDTIVDLHKMYYDSLIEAKFILNGDKGISFDDTGTPHLTNLWAGTSWHESQGRWQMGTDIDNSGIVSDIRTITHVTSRPTK